MYYDFHNSSNFTPYLGLGFGLAFVGLEASLNDGVNSITWPSGTQTNFAWNVGLGVAYSFTENMAIDLAYRYAQFGDAETADISGLYGKADTIDAHQFLLGFRYTF